MANMAYCRFGNTYRDLKDCYEEMSLESPGLLSESERMAKRDLIALCRRIVSLEYNAERMRLSDMFGEVIDEDSGVC